MTPLESREKGVKLGENIRDPLKEYLFTASKKRDNKNDKIKLAKKSHYQTFMDSF